MHDATNFKAVYDQLYYGEPLNGIGPADCGIYQEAADQLLQASQRGGVQEVRAVWDAISRQWPDLLAAVCGNPAPDARPPQYIPRSTCPALPEQARLPPDLGKDACTWLDDYIAFSRKHSPRSYDDFHEACGLWIISTVAARRVALHFGGERYTNLYIALCGRSSAYAKSTATKIALETMRTAGVSHLLAPDDSTPQAFLRHLTLRTPDTYDNLSAEQREAVIIRLGFAAQKGWFFDEFGQKISSMMREGGFMADFRGLLRKFDDCPPEYEYVTVGRGSDHITRPYLALLASLTPADLAPFARKGSALWSDGFFARYAFITPPRGHNPSRARFPEGQRIIPAELTGPLARWHQTLGVPSVQITEALDQKGNPTGRYSVETTPPKPMECSADRAVWDAFYVYHDALLDLTVASENHDLDASYTRFAEKALRIAMLFASLENGGRIELRHWARAQEITERWRASLHNLLDQLHGDAEAAEERSTEERILALITKADGARLAFRDIYRTLNLKSDQVRAILKEMERNGLVEQQQAIGENGRKVEVWAA
jgi:hypothetical protein